ncbi:hypothetical protein PL8927_780172 [Planktothrix serta PCC 8927]|uniref:Uncharacterized protein n=1 Tax=Planktothrix serta PCC 8927 TaxID=671068 RepID=A0A7Z9E2I4_9CYAN|nr:hypothetical protein PL8927_780172 [Planktothrix serta PCC 8927]
MSIVEISYNPYQGLKPDIAKESISRKNTKLKSAIIPIRD